MNTLLPTLPIYRARVTWANHAGPAANLLFAKPALADFATVATLRRDVDKAKTPS